MYSEETRQQLDPASMVGAYRSIIVIVLTSVGWAVAFTILGYDPATVPWLEILSLVLLAAAAFVVIHAANPAREPFTVHSHAFVHGMLVLACFAGAGANWGTGDFVRENWVPGSLGLLVVAMSPYRPARELIVFTSLSATFIGFATLLNLSSIGSVTPAAAFLVTTVAPLLALGFAAATYAQLTIVALKDWYRRTEIANAALSEELRDGIARSVQQDRVTILGRDVSPFFEQLLTRGEITENDRVTAQAIADSLRGVMVAEADRSWLEALVARARRSGHPFDSVDDEFRVAGDMSSAQRTALRALIVALDDGIGEVSHVEIVLSTSQGTCAGTLSVTIDADEHAVRRHYAPYFSLMRIAFTTLSTDFHHPDLIVRFSYDRP